MNTKYPDAKTTELPLIHVPDSYNYIGVFLTLNCNLCCSYCINSFGQFDRSGQLLSAEQWLEGLNNLAEGGLALPAEDVVSGKRFTMPSSTPPIGALEILSINYGR